MAQHVHNKALLTRALALAHQRPRYLLLALLVLLGFLIALFCGTAAARGDRDALIERLSDEAVPLPSAESKGISLSGFFFGERCAYCRCFGRRFESRSI